MLKIEYNIRLKALIESKGLKQSWIAKKAGLDPSAITGFVRGYLIPTQLQAKAVARVLECAVDDIF